MGLDNIAIRPLSVADVAAVTALESTCFGESERASRESVEYRLVACPELCVGLFQREFDPVEGTPRHSCIKRETLIGHILATKMAGETVDESAMEVGGHVEGGDTIGLHSLVVDPKYRAQKLATLMLRDYIQRMSQQEVASRVSLLAKRDLVKFYAKLGFVERGVSACHHGGEEWVDMVLKLEHVEDEEE